MELLKQEVWRKHRLSTLIDKIQYIVHVYLSHSYNFRKFTWAVQIFSSILIYVVNVKVKWSSYRPGVAQRLGRGIALLFHDRGTRSGWVVSSTPLPHFTPGKDPVPILQEAGWTPGSVWTGGKSRPHRHSIPDRLARNSVAIPTELLGPHIVNLRSKITILQQTVGHCFKNVARNINNSAHTRAVRKVSSHFEYLENRSHDLDVTWQPVRGDLTVHQWSVILPWD